MENNSTQITTTRDIARAVSRLSDKVRKEDSKDAKDNSSNLPYSCEPSNILISIRDNGDLSITVRANHEWLITDRDMYLHNCAEMGVNPLELALVRELHRTGELEGNSSKWRLSKKSDFDFLFGLLSQFPSVINESTGEDLIISDSPIDANLKIKWSKEGAMFEQLWKPIDKKTHPGITPTSTPTKIGERCSWIFLNDTFYPLANSARELVPLFTRTPRLFVGFSSLSPILEQYPFEDILITEENEEFRPDIQYVPATPTLNLVLGTKNLIRHAVRRNTDTKPNLNCTLSFEHTPHDIEKRIVYVPEQWDTAEIEKVLKNIGFRPTGVNREYVAEEEDALDIIMKGKKSFPSNWVINGLDRIRPKIKFSKLAVDIDISRNSLADDSNDYTCQLSLIQNNARVPFSSLFKNTRTSLQKWVKLDNGAYARIPSGDLSRLRSALGISESQFKMSNTIKMAVTSAQAVGLSALDSEEFRLNLDSGTKELLDRIKNFDNIPQIQSPENFIGDLRSYQNTGISWLNFLHSFSFAGILADEMGLGKTVQTLAFIQYIHNLEGENKKPTLIAAPTSVITNWHYEAQKFTPDLSVLLLHGPTRKENFDKIKNYDVILTTYPLLRIDKSVLEKIEWGYVILDEAQYIKNPAASTTRAVKSLKAKHRLALTGTPTENRPLELWSILDFLMPGYLGSKESFKNSWEKRILEADEGSDETIKMLRAKISPFILRRTKDQVEKDLPPKIESVLHVEMTPKQREIYNQILTELRPKVFSEISNKGIGGASISILSALLRLRQICNHPRSINDMKDMAEYDSGKFQLLQSLITEALDNDRKILVFSQFKGMLALIREWLESQDTHYMYLDGATKNRQSIINEFNTDEKCRLFLISLKAGGIGLNLTSADTVILYDPWWNPAVESQAIDRAHRIGQDKTVNVYRLVTDNSIEQHITRLKESKSKIFDDLVGGHNSSPLSLTKTDLELLFSIPT